MIGYSRDIDPYFVNPHALSTCSECGFDYTENQMAEGEPYCQQCAEEIAREKAWAALLETLDDEQLWFGEGCADGQDRKYEVRQ